MLHVTALTSLGDTHEERAAKIGFGCKDYQVRDWIRRKRIPGEWIKPVSLASQYTIEQLVDAVSVKRPEAAQ